MLRFLPTLLPYYLNHSTLLASFNELFGGQKAMDRVRNQQLPEVGPTLDTLGRRASLFIPLPTQADQQLAADEVFTSENWLVRIYKVKDEDALSRDFKGANGFAGGKRKKKLKSSPSARKRTA
jgi:dolichyl-diphosphooligosaccharide--protein glycosyltransferase